MFVRLKILVRESLFHGKKENWGLRHTVQFSEGTWHHIKFGKEKGPSRGVVQKCASKCEERAQDGTFAQRRMRSQSGVGLEVSTSFQHR